jgi:hypothetical protein
MNMAKPTALPSIEAINFTDFNCDGAATGPGAVACDGYAGGVRRVAFVRPCVAAFSGARNIKNWWIMVGSPEVMNTGEHKLFSKHENQELLIFSAQDLNTLAKGVPCLT